MNIINIKSIIIIAILGYDDHLPRPDSSGAAIRKGLSITIGIVTAISVLLVIIGGFRYVLSAGDPQAASKARSTIIYAAIGLIISISAEAIVAFVLTNTSLNGL